jgi:hypothetical protein
MQLMKRALQLLFSVVLGLMVMVPGAVWASDAAGEPAGGATSTSSCTKDASGKCASDIVGVSKTVCIALPVSLSDQKQGGCPKGQYELSNDPAKGGAIVVYLRSILKLLSGAVGLLIVLMLVIAGVQYIVSLGDPGRVKSAKDRIQNTLIALVLYLMMFAILSFLIPGGIL